MISKIRLELRKGVSLGELFYLRTPFSTSFQRSGLGGAYVVPGTPRAGAIAAGARLQSYSRQ